MTESSSWLAASYSTSVDFLWSVLPEPYADEEVALMSRRNDVRKNFWGEPDIHGIFGEYVTIGGEEYEVVKHRTDGSMIVRKAGSLFGGEEKIVEKDLFGGWHVRDRGWFDW